MERWWDITERGKTKLCEKKKKKKKKKKKSLSKWHFVHHIFHIDWSEIEPGFARQQSGIYVGVLINP
jgi:hypothetical protein